MSLIKTAARVAVASSVHGRVQQRQHRRWAAPSQAAHPEDQTVDHAAPGAGAAEPTDRLAALKTLGELRAGGVLTEAEFEAEKRKLL